MHAKRVSFLLVLFSALVATSAGAATAGKMSSECISSKAYDNINECPGGPAKFEAKKKLGAAFKSKPPPAEPERNLVLFGQEIDPLSLPEDIPSTASRLFAAGDVRAAMSLLFRGALIELARTGKLEVADFVTEEECLRLAARKLKGDDIGFLTDLTRTWQRVAYGHRMPARDRFDQLCVQWRRLLGGVT